MSRPASRRRKLRSPLRSLVDGGVFLVLLVMVLFAVRQMGWLGTRSGEFVVIDGDSLRQAGQDYRLHAIDAPELRQTCEDRKGQVYSCGREAMTALRNLLAARPATCRVIETDRYGRLVANCKAGDTDINDEMVRQGWALAYRRHGIDYVGAEADAKAARRGIWKGRFENPEDWRNDHRASPGSMSPGETAAEED